MADVQPENGTAPIAYALLDALASDPGMGTTARIVIWVLRNTYGRRAPNHGPRRKTCAFSWLKIATETGLADHRSRVAHQGLELIRRGVLFLDARGHIGIQKDYERWGGRAKVARAKVAQAKNRREGGQKPPRGGPKIDTHMERAREVLAVQSEPERVLPAPARPANGPSLLPNRLADTLRNRAELGHPEFPPDEHADWARADFKTRAQHQADWERAQHVRENDERARVAQETADRIERERAKPDAGTDHLALLRKTWPRPS